LACYNIASNEDIRHRWNGHQRNEKSVEIYNKESGCLGKLSHIFFGKVNNLHGPSKLHLFSKTVEALY